jgi:hypothetical protein
MLYLTTPSQLPTSPQTAERIVKEQALRLIWVKFRTFSWRDCGNHGNLSGWPAHGSSIPQDEADVRPTRWRRSQRKYSWGYLSGWPVHGSSIPQDEADVRATRWRRSQRKYSWGYLSGWPAHGSSIPQDEADVRPTRWRRSQGKYSWG